MRRLVFSAAIVAALSFSGGAIFAASSALQSSARQTMGGGSVWSWVQRGPDGKPQAFGVSFDEAALDGLSKDETEIPVPMPADALLSYRTAVIDWHPHGHPPAKVYDVPHFDFHFYAIDEASRLAILESGPLAVMTPPASDVPQGFMGSPSVAAMGQHYIAASEPEFNGGHFTMTPIFGYYGGKPVFVEAMVTLSALRARQETNAALAQPAHWAVPGLHPTRWSVTYDPHAHRYDVAFGGLSP